jgi:hypothetical protein
VPCGLFVPRVYQLESVADGSLENRVQMSAMERKDALDALREKHPYQDLAGGSVDLSLSGESARR